jgi:hypothetical protein
VSKLAHSNQETMDQIEANAGELPDPDESSIFIHIKPNPHICDHDFAGWRNFADGSGGEQVCTKCGMGAMAYTLATGF